MCSFMKFFVHKNCKMVLKMPRAYLVLGVLSSAHSQVLEKSRHTLRDTNQRTNSLQEEMNRTNTELNNRLEANEQNEQH